MVFAGVVIPNYNGLVNLRKCLKHLLSQSLRDFRVVVVDNGSNDGSVKFLKSITKKNQRVKSIYLKENMGFALAVNEGIRFFFEQESLNIQGVLPLNNDVFLEKDFLLEIKRAFKVYKHKKMLKKLGTLVPKLYFAKKNQRSLINSVGVLIGPDGSGMERGFREKDEGQYQDTVEVFGGSGASPFYTKEMLSALAFKNAQGQWCYFDEEFFAYYEDLDLNYRAQLQGFSAFFVPQAIGFHLHSATGKSFSPFKSFYVHRNQFFVLIKNFPLPFLIFGFCLIPWRYVLLLMSILFKRGPAFNLKEKIKKKRFGILKIVFNVWKDIFVHFPSLLKKRRQIQQKKTISLKSFFVILLKYRASIFKMIFR